MQSNLYIQHVRLHPYVFAHLNFAWLKMPFSIAAVYANGKLLFHRNKDKRNTMTGAE